MLIEWNYVNDEETQSEIYIEFNNGIKFDIRLNDEVLPPVLEICKMQRPFSSDNITITPVLHNVIEIK